MFLYTFVILKMPNRTIHYNRNFIHSTDTNTIDAKPVQMIKNTVKQKTSDKTGASTINFVVHFLFFIVKLYSSLFLIVYHVFGE